MKADGLVLLGYSDHRAHRDGLEALVAAGAPFVRWGAPAHDPPGITIGCDNREGGRLATRHLLDGGRRAIAFLGDVSDRHPEFQARRQGCEAALVEAGLPIDPALQVAAESTEDAGHAAAMALLARGRRFDAVFAASDVIAIGAMHALQAAGRRIPDDVAVVGFDDIPMARYGTPPLTTVVQDTAQAGELLVATLMQRVRGEAACNAVLPVSLSVRASSRTP
jgi:DNA-binding LacI/PurR family transcriptional regulator